MRYLLPTRKFPNSSYLPFFEREVPEGRRVKVVIIVAFRYLKSKIIFFSTASSHHLHHITTYFVTPNAGRVATTTGYTEGILLTTDKFVDSYFTFGGAYLYPNAVGRRNAFGVFKFVESGTGYRVADKINAAFVTSLLYLEIGRLAEGTYFAPLFVDIVAAAQDNVSVAVANGLYACRYLF